MALPRRTTGAAAILLTVALAASCGEGQTTAPPDALTKAPSAPPMSLTPMSFTVADDLPPIPGNVATAARPPEVVKAAYLFAARHPEVLKYMPCFCGCEQMGHRGNDDCFVARRDAGGKPTEWVTHGMICEVCIDVATQAMQMSSNGASLESIRDAIEKRHGGGRAHTPTPTPPHGGDHH